mmetsp:Transcript_13807/g.34788  ORF Transcript_13807/g.34788 Transcript_13807/m.34788 type:complete len:840 (+) Transcript_13807:9567-12086(+)
MCPRLRLPADVPDTIALAPALLLVKPGRAHAGVVVDQIPASSRLARVGRAIRGVTTVPLAGDLIGHLLVPILAMALVVIVVVASGVRQVLARPVGSTVNPKRSAIVDVLALLVARELTIGLTLHVVFFCPGGKPAERIAGVTLNGDTLRVVSISAGLDLGVGASRGLPTQNGLALLLIVIAAVRFARASEHLRPVSVPSDGVALLACDRRLLLEDESTLRLHRMSRVRYGPASNRLAHSVRQNLAVSLALGDIARSTGCLSVQSVAGVARVCNGVLILQLPRRLECGIAAGLRGPTHISGAGRVGLAFWVVATRALAIVVIDLIVARPRSTRVRCWAIVDVGAHVPTVLETLLEAAVAITVVIVQMNASGIVVINALPVTSARLTESSAIVDVDAIHGWRETGIPLTVEIISCCSLWHATEGVSGSTSRSARITKVHVGSRRHSLVQSKRRHATFDRTTAFKSRKCTIGLAIHAKLIGHEVNTIRAVTVHASVHQLVAKEEFSGGADCMVDRHSISTSHSLAQLQLSQRAVGMACHSESDIATGMTSQGMASLTGVVHRFLIDEVIRRASRRVRQSRRSTTHIPLASCVPVALLVEANGASAFVLINHILANTGAARGAGRAIVDVVAPLDSRLGQLLVAAVALAGVVVQVNSSRGGVVLACSLVVASHTPRSSAIVDVLARLESSQLTVIFASDGKISNATEHPGRGIPSIALNHLGAREAQCPRPSTGSMRRGCWTPARHGLTGLSRSVCAVCLARHRESRRPLRLRIQCEPLLTSVDHLLLVGLHNLRDHAVTDRRWHTACHRERSLRLGVRSVGLAGDSVGLRSTGFPIQRKASV